MPKLFLHACQGAPRCDYGDFWTFTPWKLTYEANWTTLQVCNIESSPWNWAKFSIWCNFACLMRQNSFFDSIQKLHFWKATKMRLKAVLFPTVDTQIQANYFLLRPNPYSQLGNFEPLIKRSPNLMTSDIFNTPYILSKFWKVYFIDSLFCFCISVVALECRSWLFPAASNVVNFEVNSRR